MNSSTSKTTAILAVEILLAAVYLKHPDALLPVALFANALFICFAFGDAIADAITEFFTKDNPDAKQYELFLDHLETVANNLENGFHMEFEKEDESMLITYMCRGERKSFGYDFANESYIREYSAENSESEFQRLLRSLSDDFEEGFEEDE